MLSVIIPARNEKYLEQTIRNILENARGEIEVLAVLDGYLPDPKIDIGDYRVKFIHYKDSIGQRRAINEAAKLARGKYIMKLDAHCAVAEGFDLVLAEDCKYEWTMIPRMYNLDIETFKPKMHKRTDYMYITPLTHEKPFRAMYYSGDEYRRLHKRPQLIDETMCCMGPGFFMHKDRFFELGGCDENHEGGWGQQGIEVSLKAWLSGGALMVNKKTWFAHWFRGGSGPGFPYLISGRTINKVREYSRDLWLNNKWEKQARTIEWLFNKFNIRNNDLTILFYTANTVDPKIFKPAVRSLKKHGYPIVSVSQEPVDVGKNIVIEKGRSLQKIYKQVLLAAENATTEYVALCEDDCFYTAEHFLYRPKEAPFAYNLNRWLLHMREQIFSYRERPILSQCIARRDVLIKNLKERMSLAEIPDKYCGEMGVFDKKLGMTEYGFETFRTGKPNMVVAHDRNTTGHKLLGKDAEPRHEIEHWGKDKYWLWKFGVGASNLEPIKVGDKSIPAQWGRGAKGKVRWMHSQIGSVILSVDDLYAHRMDFCDPRKVKSLEWFMDVFPPYLDAVIAEGKMPPEKLMTFGYYEYLLNKLHPADYDRKEKKATNKGQRRVFTLMHDVYDLYYSIKNDGLKNPLDMWREPDGQLVLNRGGRRLEILHKLGYGTVPCRVFKTKRAFQLFNPEKQIVEDESIHALGLKQFVQYKERSTDKYWVHNYLRLYDKHIGYLRPTAKKVLELGVFRGASLLLWREAFKNAQIYGVDHKPRPDMLIRPDEERMTVLTGSQQDEAFIKERVVSQGPFEVIIDDAGHRPAEMQKTFPLLFSSVAPLGWYVVEDLYGNYRRDRMKDSMIPRLKDMVDDVMTEYNIMSLHFYYNICFIQKGRQ